MNTESLLKQQAVNKLHEIMNRKDIRESGKGKSKVSNADLRRKEKDLKKLQQELSLEKEKYNQMIATYQKNIQELSVRIYILVNQSQKRIYYLKNIKNITFYTHNVLLKNMLITRVYCRNRVKFSLIFFIDIYESRCDLIS